MRTPEEILQDQIRVSELFHIYGDLLSNRQRTFIHFYYDENLSLSEIAAKHDISRQAVHDAIKHGRKALARYESTLGLRELRARQNHHPGDPGWRHRAETIVSEIEKSISEESSLDRSRLAAQVASLRELILGGGSRRGRPEREEAA